MNLYDNKYTNFALVKEMIATIELVKKFDSQRTMELVNTIKAHGKVMFTGEGSSRIFPAKNAIRQAYTWGSKIDFITESSYQAAQYNLKDFVVFLASNSGKTNEVIKLANKLIKIRNENRFGLTANPNTVLESKSNKTFVLECGKENAVAATKSVVEQAMFYESVLWNLNGFGNLATKNLLADKIEVSLTMPINQKIIEKAANAETIYFAGYNDGVAEELTLKTNEIARKKSDYLEGTYAVHGIEEVLSKNDIVFIIDPIDSEMNKFNDVLKKGVGAEVVAISSKETMFDTVVIPHSDDLNSYIHLCTGWNLLVEIGLCLGVNLDKPVRARKVGNEFVM